MAIVLAILILAFLLTLSAVRVTQMITKELSWRAAIQITLMMMMVYTFLVALAKKGMNNGLSN